MAKFFFGIPSSSFHAMIPSVLAVSYAAMALQKDLVMCIGGGSGVVTARQNVIAKVKEQSSAEVERVLWVDADIAIANPVQELVEIINDADRYHYNVVGFYNLADGRGSMTDMEGKNIDRKRFAELQQYEKISWAGMGFYYGDTPLKHQFSMKVGVGEDYGFFKDNNIELRVDKRISLNHWKSMFI